VQVAIGIKLLVPLKILFSRSSLRMCCRDAFNVLTALGVQDLEVLNCGVEDLQEEIKA